MSHRPIKFHPPAFHFFCHCPLPTAHCPLPSAQCSLPGQAPSARHTDCRPRVGKPHLIGTCLVRRELRVKGQAESSRCQFLAPKRHRVPCCTPHPLQKPREGEKKKQTRHPHLVSLLGLLGLLTQGIPSNPSDKCQTVQLPDTHRRAAPVLAFRPVALWSLGDLVPWGSLPRKAQASRPLGPSFEPVEPVEPVEAVEAVEPSLLAAAGCCPTSSHRPLSRFPSLHVALLHCTAVCLVLRPGLGPRLTRPCCHVAQHDFE